MASVSGGIFESLFSLYMIIALLVGVLVIGWLLYSMWRYRWKPGDARPVDAPRAGVIPAERGHVIWTYVMAGSIAAIMFGLAFSTISAVDTLENPPRDEVASHHNVTGFQFGWRFNYTGDGGIPFNKIGTFTVPVDTPIVLNVTAQDVWHNFAIPDYRIRVDAIPGTVNHLWFKGLEPTETHIACVVICGAGHAEMRAELHVLPKEEYAQWLTQQSDAEYAKYLRNANNVVVNATFAGGWQFPDASALAAGKPVVFNVTNEAASAVEVAVLSDSGAVLGSRTVQPGEAGLLYAVAPKSGSLALSAGGEQRSLGVS